MAYQKAKAVSLLTNESNTETDHHFCHQATDKQIEIVIKDTIEHCLVIKKKAILTMCLNM